LARASLALVLRVIFGAPKSCALVNLFMICPQWSASGLADHDEILPPDHGHLMAHAHARLRFDARGCDGGVRQELATALFQPP